MHIRYETQSEKSVSVAARKVLGGVLRGICRYDQASTDSAGIPLEPAHLQGSLVVDLAWVWADRRRRSVVRQWRKHQMAGGRSSEMESSTRGLDSAAAERTAVWSAVRAVGVALRTGARSARHQSERIPTGIPGPLRGRRRAIFSRALGSIGALQSGTPLSRTSP